MGDTLSGEGLKVSIPNFATISNPLWDLTVKDVWELRPKEVKPFQEIKNWLTRAPVMAYFREGAEIRLTTDASPLGVGEISEQKQKDGNYPQIEMRYS